MFMNIIYVYVCVCITIIIKERGYIFESEWKCNGGLEEVKERNHIIIFQLK